MYKVASIIHIVFLFGLAFFQGGMGLYLSICAKQFASDPPEPTPPVSMLFGMISGPWGIGGLMTAFLTGMLFLQELRIKRLERGAEQAPTNAAANPAARNE